MNNSIYIGNKPTVLPYIFNSALIMLGRAVIFG